MHQTPQSCYPTPGLETWPYSCVIHHWHYKRSWPGQCEPARQSTQFICSVDYVLTFVLLGRGWAAHLHESLRPSQPDIPDSAVAYVCLPTADHRTLFRARDICHENGGFGIHTCQSSFKSSCCQLVLAEESEQLSCGMHCSPACLSFPL